jgi:hypothetical protein
MTNEHRFEGLGRARMRASMNKAFMAENNGRPPHFWEQVDKTTCQTAAMFLPLYNAIGNTGATDQSQWPQFYQGLHNIVAYAGWINVANSISPNITLIEWVQPGHIWESNDANPWDEGYQNSVALALAHDTQKDVSTERTARVKISVFPSITQISARDDGRPGYMSWEVTEPLIVLYQGHITQADDDMASRTLSDHVRQLDNARKWRLYTYMLVASTLAFSTLAIVRFVVFRCYCVEREPEIYGLKKHLWLGFSHILGGFQFCNPWSKILFGIKCLH